MRLDINTLFLVTIYVEAMLGLLLLFAWVQNTRIVAVAWWGMSHLLRAASVVIFGLYGSVSDLISIDLANAVLFTAFAMTWTGARVFSGRSPYLPGLIAGAVLSIVVSRIPAIAQSIDARTLVSSGIITAYIWLAAYEFWHGRKERLVSCWPAIFILFAHGSLFLLRTPLSAALPWSVDAHIFESVWMMTVLSFEPLLFTIAIAFILLAMAKERTELLHKTASLVDSLTGIANRRAFLEGCAMLTRRVDATPKPAAALLIDLDHFKRVNDNFGHAVGDRALQIFAQVASDSVGPFDLVGRLGGEEFAALLHDADKDSALAVAETIRRSFAKEAVEIDGRTVNATVSIGIAVSPDGPLDVSAMLAEADQALYQAKERGRNRIEVASLDLVLRLDASTPSLRINALAREDAA